MRRVRPNHNVGEVFKAIILFINIKLRYPIFYFNEIQITMKKNNMKITSDYCLFHYYKNL